MTLDQTHFPAARLGLMLMLALFLVGCSSSGSVDIKAHYLREKGDYAGAIAEYDKALSANPGSYHLLMRRADTWVLLGDFDRAIADYSEGLRVQPDSVFAHNSRGVAYSVIGDYERAFADFDAALKIGLPTNDPEIPNVYNNRGATFGEMEKHERALVEFDEAIRRAPREQKFLMNRGRGKFYVGRYTDSESDFAAVADLNARAYFARIWRYLAAQYGRGAGRTELAEFAAKADMSRYPGHLVLLFLGETDVQTVTNAAGEKRCDLLYFLGQHALLERNIDLAEQRFRETLNVCRSFDPSYKSAKVELKRLPRT